MDTSAFDIALRFSGLKETPGAVHNPQVMAMLKLDQAWPPGDETPWCSAFVSYVAWLLDLPRSKRLSARSWLKVGNPIMLEDARPGFDIVVLNRGGSSDPAAPGPGHVGFFAGIDQDGSLLLLGGNQGDRVCVATFAAGLVLGVRRLA